MKKTIDKYSDIELCRLMCEDKQTADEAFAELYERTAPKVYAFCLRFFGNKAEAQDVFQDVYIKLYENLRHEIKINNVVGYFIITARNHCLNHVARNKYTMKFEDYMAIAETTTNDENEKLELIKSSLELLTEEYREVFILREYHGMPYSEIADIIGEKITTVKIRIHRAKQKIREILEPYLKELAKYDN